MASASRAEPSDSAPRADAQDNLRPTRDSRLASLRIRVVEKDTGRPIAGKQVDIWPANVSSHWTVAAPSSPAHLNEFATTDDDGLAEFVLPAGDYSADVSGVDDPNGSASIALLAEAESREVLIQLPTRNDIAEFGRVVDAETGEPIAEARVQLVVSPRRSRDPALRPVVLSGPDGSFRLDAPSWRDPVARVSAPAFAPAVVDISDEHSDAAQPLVVELKRPASVIARVVDDAGAPIARAYVRIATAGFAFDREHFGSDPGQQARYPGWSQRTERDGRCTLDGLVPDVPLFVEVDAPGRVPRRMESITLSARESREITLTVGRGTSVSGRIEDQHQMAAQFCEVCIVLASRNARVLLDTDQRAFARVTSDESGRFRIDDVPEGLWWIGALDGGEDSENEADAQLIAPVGQPLSVAATPIEMVLHVDRGLYVSGTVLDPDGEPTADIAVEVQREGMFLCANSDEAGRFAIGPLCDGEWTVAACDDSAGYAPSVPVHTTPNSTGLVVQLRRGGHINFQLIDAATAGTCDAEVEVARNDETGSTEDETEDGALIVGGLAEGSYSAYAVSADHRVACARDIALAPGATVGPIVLRLKRAATLHVRYTGKRASLHCAVGIGPIVIDSQVLRAGGQVEFADVPDEAYLELRDLSTVVERRELHVAPGERREVVFSQP